MHVWLVILGMGIVMHAIRLSLVGLLGRVAVPPMVRQVLNYIPPAVLSAIIFPEVFRPGGQYGSLT